MFKPMLAATVEDVTVLLYPLLASPKLDGVRAIVVGGVIVSRNLKPIPNRHVQELFGKEEFEGLDGELIVGHPCEPDAFRKTSSGVMSFEGEPDVGFYVFDAVNHGVSDLPFSERLAYAERICGEYPKKLVFVGHSPVEYAFELLQIEAEVLGKGYEGIMLRNPSGHYKNGRSTLREGLLMKLKRFSDSEAVVTGFEEQMHNANEATLDKLGRTKRSSHGANMKGKKTLGALKVQDLASHVEFDIGTGFDDVTRAALWSVRKTELMGKIIKYKYFPTGSKDKPRFPVFIGFRDPSDL